MTKKELALVALLLMMLVGAVWQAEAKNPRPAMNVNVPFGFSIGERILPAGEYVVQTAMVSKPGEPMIEVLVLQNPEQHVYETLMVGASPETGTSGMQMTFHCYGSECYLASVRNAGWRLTLHQPQAESASARLHRVETRTILSDFDRSLLASAR